MRTEGLKGTLLSALVIASLMVPAVLFIPASQASAQLADTPWPKFRHDEQNTGRSPYAGARDNALKWSYAIGCGGGTLGEAPSPAVGADGTIYMGSDDNRLYALNPDGTLKWFYETGRVIRSSPAVGANGTIYVTSEDGKLYALDENGTLKWTFDNIYAYPSPAIGPDGTVYVGSCDPYFVSLSALHENGDLKWSFNTVLQRICGIFSCPAIGPDGTIYFTVVDVFKTEMLWASGYGPVGYLFALDENGARKWVIGAGGTSSPAIGADGTIYVGSGKTLIALNPDNTIKWSHVIGRACSSPAIGSDGTIFVGGGSTLYALNPDNTLKWSYATGGIIWSSPAVGVGTVYVGSRDGKLYAFFENGTLLWTYATGGEVYSSPAISAGGTIYVGSNDSKLYAIGQLAKFSLVTLYEIGLDVDLYLPTGSKLIVKFYTYADAYEGENLLWSGTTPTQVTILENIRHPQDGPVKKVRLVLTDGTGAEVATINTFTVRRSNLMGRITEIDMEWPYASFERRSVLMSEIADIDMQWPYAPF